MSWISLLSPTLESIDEHVELVNEACVNGAKVKRLTVSSQQSVRFIAGIRIFGIWKSTWGRDSIGRIGTVWHADRMNQHGIWSGNRPDLVWE